MSANHILVAYKNVEGHGHGPLDFHAPTKALFNLQVLVAKGLRPILGGGGRRLVEAISHTRPRACDHCTSSTLIVGKGRANPSLLPLRLRNQQIM